MSADFLSHAEAQDLFPAYLANELDAERHEAVTNHLKNCAFCRAELAEIEQLLRGVSRLQRPIRSGPSIADAVMAQVSGYSPYAEEPVPQEASQRSLSRVEIDVDRLYEASLNGRGSVDAPVRGTVPPARRGMQSLVAALALLAVVALMATLLLSRLPGNPGGQQKISPAPTTSPTQTPAAKNWHAVYLDSNFLVHIVSASGDRSTNLSLPTSNLRSSPQSPRLGISSDGRYLAYIDDIGGSGGPVTVIDLTTNKTILVGPAATELHWAPDAPRLAIGMFELQTTPVSIVDISTLREAPVTSPAAQSVIRIVGWIDATHLAVVASDGPITLGLESLDLASGKMTLLTDVGSPPDLFLSPDGQRMFIAPTYWDRDARVVDLTTKKVRELPQIRATFANSLGHLDNYNAAYGGNWAYQWAWKPGTHTLALSLSSSSIPNEGETQPVTQDAGVWLIDVDGDHATRINHNRYPLAWSPDGQTLLMSDITGIPPLNSGFVVGPTLFALSPVVSGGKARTLAKNMMAFFGSANSA